MKQHTERVKTSEKQQVGGVFDRLSSFKLFFYAVSAIPDLTFGDSENCPVETKTPRVVVVVS